MKNRKIGEIFGFRQNFGFWCRNPVPTENSRPKFGKKKAAYMGWAQATVANLMREHTELNKGISNYRR